MTADGGRWAADDRRTTIDGRANPCAVVVGRSSKEEKTFTTKAPRHQGNNHREDREGREERFHRRGTEAQRAQREKDASHKRRGHGEKNAVAWNLGVLDLGRQ
jgi:hypothetical protein